jgi:hypothetical protein
MALFSFPMITAAGVGCVVATPPHAVLIDGKVYVVGRGLNENQQIKTRRKQTRLS